jgi:hypothetical protein
MDEGRSISFRVTMAQRRRVEKRASDLRKTIAEYAREMTLGEPIYDATLGEAYRKAFAYASKTLEADPVAMELFEECFRHLERYFQ